MFHTTTAMVVSMDMSMLTPNIGILKPGTIQGIQGKRESPRNRRKEHDHRCTRNAPLTDPLPLWNADGA